ncbi:MAG TPA: DUF397 domain-containing protein [Pseudonocardiaceae bacterium]|jgi:hypothetical protein|nr:DUF397 domain-containing protein [Pseudonocardiaceae bacterium]
MNHNQALAELTTAAAWRKSSYSQGQNGCVEVATELPGWVGVRDSKLGTDSPVLSFTLPEWRAMLAAAQAGELGATRHR